VWHRRAHQDPAHRWLREQVVAVADDIGEMSGRSGDNRARR